MCCVVSCELITYNAALNRPDFQSSVRHDRYGYFVASLANDGNHETNAVRGGRPQCAHSRHETNPWWSVDLGRPTAVYRVDFTNRGDAAGVKNFRPISILFSIKLYKSSSCCIIIRTGTRWPCGTVPDLRSRGRRLEFRPPVAAVH